MQLTFIIINQVNPLIQQHDLKVQTPRRSTSNRCPPASRVFLPEKYPTPRHCHLAVRSATEHQLPPATARWLHARHHLSRSGGKNEETDTFVRGNFSSPIEFKVISLDYRRRLADVRHATTLSFGAAWPVKRADDGSRRNKGQWASSD